MASATLVDALRNIELILRCCSNDDFDARWEAICGDLRIYAAGGNELLARFVAHKPYLDSYLFDMSEALVFDDSDLEWAEVAGKGSALLWAGLAEHVGHQSASSGRDRIKTSIDFIERRHCRILRHLAQLPRLPRPTSGRLDYDAPD
jgi:hypothetical protein